MINCPKCSADVSDTYEPDDWSVGVVGGYYCDACDLGIAEHEVSDQYPDDELGYIASPAPAKEIGTPISELSGRPGTKGFAELSRIAKSWGYD